MVIERESRLVRRVAAAVAQPEGAFVAQVGKVVLRRRVQEARPPESFERPLPRNRAVRRAVARGGTRAHQEHVLVREPRVELHGRHVDAARGDPRP